MKKKKDDVVVETVDPIQKDITAYYDKLEAKDLKKRYKELMLLNQNLREEIDALKLLSKVKPTGCILPTKGDSSEAVAFLLASDWHMDEIVKPNTVNGLNEFSLKIARQRASNFFTNGAKLVNFFKTGQSINHIVLSLMGDFLSGNIHEELLENTSLRPIEAAMEVVKQLALGIDYLLDNTDCSITVPCSVGNHSRINQKIHVSTESGNSLETFIYYTLSNMFRTNNRVTFIINDSYLTYIDIIGFKVRQHHGHAIKYSGGVMGAGVPITKAIAAWDKAIQANLTICGHLHTSLENGHYVVNGSLIGYNSFAVKIKATPEKPQQTFFLLDKKYGKTVSTPIFL